MAELSIAEGGRSAPRHGVSLREAFRVWLRVAMLSFGGPAGQIAVMHRILVEEKRWISESRFLHALNYCMLLPGPEAQQLATYIGWLMHRTLGGIMAGVLFVRPRHHRHHGAQLHLCRLRQCAGDCGAVFRTEGSGARDRAGGGGPDRQARAQEQRDARARRGRIRRHLLFRHSVSDHHFRCGVDRFCRRWTGAASFQVSGGHGDGKQDGGVADSLLGEELPEHARPTVARALRVSGVWLALWLIPVIALLVALGAGTSSARSRSSSARWPWSPSAAPMRCSPMSPSRRSRITAGSSPARCSTASAWRRPRRGR